MKKIIIMILLTILPFNVYSFELKSKNVILYNLNEDMILYEEKADEKVYIASLTKIMTAIVALENIDSLDDEIIMTKEMFKSLIEQNASLAGFSVGEKVTYRDLLYGLMLPSGAEAAQALAITTSGGVDNFVKKMNKKANELGLTNTKFSNVTGLDDPNNYSTVRDVSVILKYGLKNKEFEKIFNADKYVTSNKKHTFIATRNKYNIDTSFITGSKTGFTYDAGLCMASTSNYDGVNYLLVTAHAPYNNRTNHLYDAKNIYEFYFNNYENKEIVVPKTEITTIFLEDNREIKYYTNKTVTKYLSKNCELNGQYEGKNEISKDTKVGTKIGEYIIKCDEKIVYSENIYLVQNYDDSKKINIKLVIFLVSIVFLIIITSIIFRFKHKRKQVQN